MYVSQKIKQEVKLQKKEQTDFRGLDADVKILKCCMLVNKVFLITIYFLGSCI